MAVAAGALESQAQEGGGEGVGPVGDVLDPELFLNASTLVGLTVVAVEGCREDLRPGGLRLEVAGQLSGDEPVVG